MWVQSCFFTPCAGCGKGHTRDLQNDQSLLRLLLQDAITRAEEQLRIFFESVRRRARRQTLGPHAGNDLERAEGIRNRAPPSRDSRPPLL